MGDVLEAAEAPSAKPIFPLPHRPSIAVLPFLNMSNDPEQDYFTDGITEDIITALSHVRWLFVIARSSTFTYKGQAIDVTRIGRDLGVRYVLEGSVRRIGNQVRTTVQLVEAEGATHISAQRYDHAVTDIFALQTKSPPRSLVRWNPRSAHPSANAPGAGHRRISMPGPVPARMVASPTTERPAFFRSAALLSQCHRARSRVRTAARCHRVARLFYHRSDVDGRSRLAGRGNVRGRNARGRNPMTPFIHPCGAWPCLSGAWRHAARHRRAQTALVLNPSSSLAHWSYGWC